MLVAGIQGNHPGSGAVLHSWLQDILALVSGGAVGLSLSVIGGGGSILAVPLLLYVVGVADVHVAIGTSALAVATSALANFIGHWRVGNVKWSCATIFAAAGIVGASIGSSLGKIVNGRELLSLFALAMIVVSAAMLRSNADVSEVKFRMTSGIAIRLGVIGFAVGTISGLFGIGGGFLIVPGIMFGSGVPILHAIGSSLLSVASFALTTAANYTLSGLVDWWISFLFIGGGVAGGIVGVRFATRLAESRGLLTKIFAGVVFTVAIVMLVRIGPRF
jgi:uncharacterized membrane protein YfcA